MTADAADRAGYAHLARTVVRTFWFSILSPVGVRAPTRLL